MNKSVENVYNTLFKFESRFRLKHGQQSYPIHKKLAFEKDIQSLTGWIEQLVDIPDNAHILDAGCGTGNTLLELCRGHERTGLGISVSQKEIEFASEKNALNDQCRFMVQSYDKPFTEKFDLIVAIESLKHSDDLQKSMVNLTNHLKKGGRMVIIDDFLIHRNTIANKKITNKHPVGHYENSIKKNWSAAHLFSKNELINILDKMGYQHETFDLTPFVKRSRKFFLPIKLLSLYMLTIMITPFKKHHIFRIFYAGYCLEQLYRIGKMKYLTFVTDKRS